LEYVYFFWSIVWKLNTVKPLANAKH
jgi:hypothetical protein